MKVCRVRRTIACVIFGALIIGTTTGEAATATPRGDKLGPASKRDALLAQPEESYQFVLRGSSAAIKAARLLARKGGGARAPVRLDAFDSAALTLKVRDAATLCGRADVKQVWYLNPVLADSYVKVLSGLQYVYRTLDAPTLVNMSIGPPTQSYPIPIDPNEPMQSATHRLAEKGLIPVVAIGNFGESGDTGWTNPWCAAEWVICVGAATGDGQTLWPKSSRGVPDDPRTWPSVVARGVDVIGPWPVSMKKSDQRRRYDESNADFIASVPPDRRQEFTLMSGSSQATAQVTRAAAQIIFFVQRLAETEKKAPGDRLFSLLISRDRFEFGARLGVRLTGAVVRSDDQNVEVEYRLVEPWRLVKQLLIDTAIPMKGYRQNEVGAGFVSPSYVEEQFGTYGIASKKLLPVKVE